MVTDLELKDVPPYKAHLLGQPLVGNQFTAIACLPVYNITWVLSNQRFGIRVIVTSAVGEIRKKMARTMLPNYLTMLPGHTRTIHHERSSQPRPGFVTSHRVAAHLSATLRAGFSCA